MISNRYQFKSFIYGVYLCVLVFKSVCLCMCVFLCVGVFVCIDVCICEFFGCVLFICVNLCT